MTEDADKKVRDWWSTGITEMAPGMLSSTSRPPWRGAFSVCLARSTFWRTHGSRPNKVTATKARFPAI